MCASPNTREIRRSTVYCAYVRKYAWKRTYKLIIEIFVSLEIFFLIPRCALLAVFVCFVGYHGVDAYMEGDRFLFVFPLIERGVATVDFGRCEASEKGSSLRIDTVTAAASAAFCRVSNAPLTNFFLRCF